jgi:hypothetical protein
VIERADHDHVQNLFLDTPHCSVQREYIYIDVTSLRRSQRGKEKENGEGEVRKRSRELKEGGEGTWRRKRKHG